MDKHDYQAHRRHDRYLLREGHFLGFGAGLVLSRWWWLAVTWGVVVLALWAYDLGREGADRG